MQEIHNISEIKLENKLLIGKIRRRRTLSNSTKHQEEANDDKYLINYQNKTDSEWLLQLNQLLSISLAHFSSCGILTPYSNGFSLIIRSNVTALPFDYWFERLTQLSEMYKG